MADILREVFGIFQKRYRDMGDGTHAEVVAIGGAVSDSWRAFSLIDEAADDSDKSFWFFVSDGPIANAMIAGEPIEDASIEYLAQVNIDLFAPATASEV